MDTKELADVYPDSIVFKIKVFKTTNQVSVYFVYQSTGKIFHHKLHDSGSVTMIHTTLTHDDERSRVKISENGALRNILDKDFN